MTEPHRLCLILEHWAWFTNKPIAEQRGDDWNDCPYEHNAGRPYEDEAGQIVRVAWDGPFDAPRDLFVLTSVDEINDGAFPWLQLAGDASTPTSRPVRSKLFVGVTLAEFIYWVQQHGGKTYLEVPS